MCKLCYYTIHIDRPRTGCEFAGNLHINATFPAGRLITAPTSSEEAASVNVGAIIDRPRTGYGFAGNLHVNAALPAGRLWASAPTIVLGAVASVAGLTVRDSFFGEIFRFAESEIKFAHIRVSGISLIRRATYLFNIHYYLLLSKNPECVFSEK